MKILITGSAGFIGRYLCAALKKGGIDFIGYDLENGDDIRDRIKLDKLFEAENFDIVIHMAALAGVRRSKDFPEEYISTNINGTLNVVEMCKKYNCKLIFFSSSSVLGGNHFDVDGKMNGLKEDDSYNPKSLYAITKMAGECIVKNILSDYIIVRPFTVYGENGRPDMGIYKWINQIKAGKPITVYGDGLTKRGYTHVNDLVNGILRLMLCLDGDYFSSPNIVHLGGSEIISLNDVLNIFDKVCKSKKIKLTRNSMDIPQEDVLNSYSDNDYAFYLIGFSPQKQFEKIITKILKQEL